MICEQTLKRFCCEDISLIENYEQAINDDIQMWDCHHRFETDKGLSKKQLIEIGLYWHRPACELIFLTRAEHYRLHFKGKQSPLKGKPSPNKGKKNPKISAAMKGKPNCNKGKKIPAISAAKKGKKIPALSAALKGKPITKYVWLTPDGELVVMATQNVNRYHPDWIRIEEI